MMRRDSAWHETRPRAAGMHADYVWHCYAAQLRLRPRVRACVPDWVCLQPHALQTARKSLCYTDQSAVALRGRCSSSARAAPLARFVTRPGGRVWALRPHAVQTAGKSLCYTDQSAVALRGRCSSSACAAPLARLAPTPHTDFVSKSCRGGGLLVGCISIILGRSSIIERRC